MSYLMMKLLGRLYMNEPAADGGQGDGGNAPAPTADPAPATAPTPAPETPAPTAPAEPNSLLGNDPNKPTEPAKPGEGDEGKDNADKPLTAPEAYEAFTLPEGEELDENALPMVQDLFKELGLPQDKAQEVLNKLMEIDKARQPTQEQVQAMQVERITALNASWGEACKKLPELGGDNFAKSAEVAAKVMTQFGTPELREVLNYSALGSHPEFFKFIHAVGKSMSQDTMVHGGEEAPSSSKSPAERLWPDSK